MIWRAWWLLLLVLVALAAPASAQAVWTAPVVLSEQGLDASLPEVAVDQSGNTIFLWLRFDGTTDCGGFPGCERAQVRVRSTAGILSAVQTFSDAGRSADSAHIAVDSSGSAVVVWRRSDDRRRAKNPLLAHASRPAPARRPPH